MSWQRDRVLVEWTLSMDYAQKTLLNNSTKTRIQFLRDELLPLAKSEELNLSQIMDIFKLLTMTYPRYTDDKSREAVEAVGMELVKSDEQSQTGKDTDHTKFGVAEQILGWLSNEVGRLSKRGAAHSAAPSNLFVLLSWSCSLYTICAQNNHDFISTHLWTMLVGNMAVLLDMLTESSKAKPSLKKGGLVKTRRALRSAGDKVPAVIESLLINTTTTTTTTGQTPLRMFTLIGVAVSVLIRLKHVAEEPAARLPKDLKHNIITTYSNTVLMSKVQVPDHILTSLHDFTLIFVSPDDFTATVLPTIEKALLRSPEHGLPAATNFFLAYPYELDANSLRRMLTQAINSAKSSNPLVRANAIHLFNSLFRPNKSNTHDLSRLAVPEILNLPKTGKSAGPDHRVALYSMLACLTPASGVSSSIIESCTPLLAKETHEAASIALTKALSPHIKYVLGDTALPLETTQLIAKEMNSSKVAVRKAFCDLAGSILFEIGERLINDGAIAFAKAVLPSFENCLKNVAGNPLNFSGGPFEGYVAIAVLLNTFQQSGNFGDVVSKNPVISSITSSTTKQSFLLWDKIYQRVSDAEEEKWLLRAWDASLKYFRADLAKNGALRAQFGLVPLHLALDSLSPSVRQDVHRVLEAASRRDPKLINEVIRDSLTSFLARGPPASSAEESNTPWNKHSRLSTVLLSTISFQDDINSNLRENLVVDLLIIGHHYLICGPSRQTWIDLCQKASIDPRQLTEKYQEKLLELIRTTAISDSKHGFAKASYSALTTLVFVSPSTILPRVMEQMYADLNPDPTNALTELDLGIWATPEGITYVDVLSTTKSEAGSFKGKDAEIMKWEESIRKSLADKKASGQIILSKQQQAAVQAQLEKESKIRQRVVDLKANLDRGLHYVQSVVAADVVEFRTHVSDIVALLLNGPLRRGSFLVGGSAFETYLELAKCTAERLDTMRKWIGVATLRCLELDAIPEELQAEPIHQLVIRVLYRLRFSCEQAPFDPATFSYAFPLIGQVLLKGGISVNEEDEALEQLTLALSFIKYHCGEFADSAFPRLQTLEHLIHVIRHQPKLSKEASSALVDLGEAIHSSATRVELDVLLQGTLLQESHVRNSCLQTIQPFDLTDLDWSAELWIACHDEDEQNARLARHVWEDNGLDVPETFLDELVLFLNHENNYVRSSSAVAIAEAVEQFPQSIQKTLSVLQHYYRDKAKILAPEYDEYGMVIAQSLERSDPWSARLATSMAFEYLAPTFTDDAIEPFFKFLIFDEALGDRTAEVRRGMLTSGSKVIDLHGMNRLAALISLFEQHLSKPSPATETGDWIKEAVVILFGRVARHLEATDPRIPSIVDRLVEALKTPSEQVQIAVSECLTPLVRLMRPRLPTLVDKLLEDLFISPNYATRRGAAYGLAGVLKGTGIPGMKEFSIISKIKTAVEDKKRYESRQGAMFAFETLSTTLGRLFEPYITFALPLLLTSFGDTTADVREATQDAARVIMSNLSGFGVKLILPTLLEGLEEKQWRTKKGSIELLGMMAYCSPRQLSISLPIVIPRLTSVLTDSHAQVRAAANKSLKQFGEVISNPEIQSLVPVLLKALVDPTKTPNALSSLLKTSFMHYIDHSSLALVIPILERGLRERGAETKKKAAQIVGNLASLTDSKDFVPYLDELLPMVHLVLVDPVPEARATAAKALGTLVERLGEVHFPDLVPGLLRTLKTDTSGVDRQGAAQGLSEVLSGLGMERLEGLLPDIIANSRSPRPTVREGFMSLLVYLPATFGTRFQPHLPKIITPILNGLSDSEEYVREAAMRAGRMVVTNYSNRAIDLLLPELEHGMFDPGWRIRQSSITLVGELLFKVSGISGKASELEEDDVAVEATAVAESSRRVLIDILGMERRDRILAALYLVRQDGVSVVRQSSIQIWKALVHNTPRTVREILPELVNQIVNLLANDEPEQQETAGRTIGELCRKLGEKILGEIIQITRAKSTSPDARTRRGVSLALSEIMQNSTEGQREDYEDDIIAMVRASLVDDEANVRSAAAQAFDILQEYMGPKAIDQTIPVLLEALRQPGQSSGTALQALREVMAVRASTVFPVLIPTLTAIPMTVFNARALASLVTVAGNALSKRLTAIMNAVVQVLENEKEEELAIALDEAIRALFSSISDAEGLNTLMMILLGWVKNERPRRRVSACDLYSVFCEVSELDSSLYRIDWIRQLISSLEDQEVTVHTAASKTLDGFVKSIPKDELEPLVVPLRRSIESTGGHGQSVPGLSLPKGVAPLVPIIIAGLTTGSNEQREQAAYAIGDLVERTEESAIKPHVVQFTGPLIRVATQATTYPPAVKTAILSALTSMLERIPAYVKPFFPQLQRTFVKSISDPSSNTVRAKAAQALGVLMKNQPRVDPVITELITGVKTNDELIATNIIVGIARVVKSGSKNVGEKAIEACVEVVSDAFRTSHDDHYCQAIGALVSSLTPHADILKPVVLANLVGGTPPSATSSHVILTVLEPDDDSETSESPNLFQKLNLLRSVAQKVIESAANEKPVIARPAREARDILREMDDDSLNGLF